MKNIKIPNNAMYGIFFMLIHTLCLSLIDISAKILRESGFSSGFIVFCYKFSLFLFILPFVLYNKDKYIRTKRIWVHIIRSISGTLGALFFYHGLKYLPMSDASAIENMQYLVVFCLGFIIFKEKISKTKIIAVLIGFLGVLFVVKSEWFFDANSSIVQASQNKTYIYTIIAVLFWSFNSITIKILGKTEHNMTQMFYILLFASIISFPTAIFNWNPVDIMGLKLKIYPSLIHFDSLNLNIKFILIIFGMSIIYFIHASAYFLSLRSDLSIVVPFRYTKLVFSAGLGYLIFAENIYFESFIGYGFIISSGLILARYQYNQNKNLNKNSNDVVNDVTDYDTDNINDDTDYDTKKIFSDDDMINDKLIKNESHNLVNK